MRRGDGTFTVEQLRGPDTWRVFCWTGSTWQVLGPEYPTEKEALASREYRLGTTSLLRVHRRGIVVPFRSGLSVEASWVELVLLAALLVLAAVAVWRGLRRLAQLPGRPGTAQWRQG